MFISKPLFEFDILGFPTTQRFSKRGRFWTITEILFREIACNNRKGNDPRDGRGVNIESNLLLKCALLCGHLFGNQDYSNRFAESIDNGTGEHGVPLTLDFHRAARFRQASNQFRVCPEGYSFHAETQATRIIDYGIVDYSGRLRFGVE